MQRGAKGLDCVKGFSLPNIEQVIRHTLEKIDTSRGDLREQVYRVVWENHEKSIVADEQLTDEDRGALRDRLILLIQSIEEEYGLADEEEGGQGKSQDTVLSSSQDEEIGEALDAKVFNDNTTPSYNDLEEDNRINDELDQQDIIPTQNIAIEETRIRSAGPEELGFAPTGGQASRPQKRNSWWRSNLILMVLLVLLVLVAFAFYNSLTSINRPAGEEPDVSTPPATINQQTQTAETDGWITVFDPTRVSDFSVQGTAEAEIKGEGNNRALRFTSKNADDKVVIDVGEGVIEQLRGKTVTFNLVARSANDAAAQIAITCDFGVDNSCGKRNFDLHQTREDLLFSVEIPQNINQNGQLFLQSALLGPDYKIDVFAVRVRFEN